MDQVAVMYTCDYTADRRYHLQDNIAQVHVVTRSCQMLQSADILRRQG